MEKNIKNIFTDEAITQEVKDFVSTLIDELTEGTTYYYNLKVGGKPSYETLKKSPVPFRKEVVSYLITTIVYWRSSKNANTRIEQASQQVLALMMRSKQNFGEEEFVTLLNAFQEPASQKEFYYWAPVYYTLSQLEKFAKKNPLSARTQEYLRGLLEFQFPYMEIDKSKLKIKELLLLSGDPNAAFEPVVLDDADSFGQAVNTFTASLDDSLKPPYYNFIKLCKKTKEENQPRSCTKHWTLSQLLLAKGFLSNNCLSGFTCLNNLRLRRIPTHIPTTIGSIAGSTQPSSRVSTWMLLK